MSKARPSPSALILDMANNPRHSRVNGALDRSTRQRDEDTLRFLSPEEKECLQFFEETIGSLENSLEEDGFRAELAKSPASASRLLGHEMDGPPESPDLYAVLPVTARRLSAKDQDIIDLVRPDPDMMLAKLPVFKPTSPDFQKMTMSPESHFEIKPRHDPLHHSGYELTDEHSYHPAGSVPTPVLIAKKIAENQAVAAPNTLASLQRRHSQEDVKSPGLDGVPPTKQGPPTLAKPTRYPANIGMIIGNRELQNQPGSNVNLHDRRALMLSNLTGAPQALLQEDSKPILVHKLQKVPSRSASFKDPTPEKTRMEALSKLGLARNCDLPGEMLGHDSLAPSRETSLTRALETSVRQTMTGIHAPDSKVPTSPQSHTPVQKVETPPFDSPRSFENRKPPASPPHLEKTSAAAPQSEVLSLELNSFGGKSIVVAPGPSKNEPVTPLTGSDGKVLLSMLANPSEFNSYGGKSKVLNPATEALTRSDLPDILSSHIDINQNVPVKPQPLPAKLNSYGGKSRTINPSVGVQRPADSPGRALKGPPPTPAPRNPQTSHPNAGKAAVPDAKPRAAAPMFRPQGITVQFSGRGATEESRKQALKKLGLLKES
ncbi:proline and serine-rich protein 2 [Hippocampus zosterae]|uniref:proline and serine-rich protein 2 n=1 Tax=Hippocampus zosterae TaxID=109293 RepID=UPI00223CE43B|nr:proline and serine-rich protein 2 [Hippocampus zosterae]